MVKIKYGIGWDERLSNKDFAYRNAKTLSSIKGVKAMVENFYDDHGILVAQYGLSAKDQKSFKKALNRIITFRGDVLGDLFWLTIDGKQVIPPNWNIIERYLR